ncbi:MAG TPA: DUF4166 domain-containing protein [Gemmataceae bacterium]|nr:DUF4166 domain-containing protein [Gemmataceae bacterium]
METIRSLPARLYPQILGTAWYDLDEAVQRLHGEPATVRATGTFRVRHGANWLARLLVRLAGLPAAGEAVEVQLAVIPRDHGEEWRRAFAGRLLVSFQWQRPDGLLAEQMGLLELWFRLEVAGGMLIYHPQRAALRLGSLRLPLPRWCAPRVAAWEKPVGDGESTQVSVEVSLPLLGLLVAYEGTLTGIEAQK